jgi:hypothetical protein
MSKLINEQYPLSTHHENHTFVNRGVGGGTSCRFAKGFNSEQFNLDVKGADLIFLEFAVNDGVMGTNEINSCYESLIIRTRKVSPNATIVALGIMHQAEQELITRHCGLVLIYLGSVSMHYPDVFLLERGYRIHLNDIGSFLE